MIAWIAMPTVPATGLAKERAGDNATTALVWPKPPDAARVRYAGQIHSESDVGKKKSVLGRMKKALVGEDDQMTVLVRPHDVHVDTSGRIYVTDRVSGGRLVVFTPSSRSGREIVPTGQGQLAKPLGLGGDGLDRLYVADPGARRVVSLNSDGSFAMAFGGPRILLNPVDVAAEPSGQRIYVADSYLHQVVIFDGTGQLIRRVGRDEVEITDEPRARSAGHGGSHTDSTHASESSDLKENRSEEPGAFRYPAYVAVGPDGNLYVTDSMNFRVQVLDGDGNYRYSIGQLGQTPGSLARPKGVGVDSQGHVYVVDAAFNNVQVFDGKGELLMAFGDLGSDRGQFWQPLGLGVTNDRIFVVDRFNDRVQLFDYLHVDNEAPGKESGGDESVRTEEP